MRKSVIKQRFLTKKARFRSLKLPLFSKSFILWDMKSLTGLLALGMALLSTDVLADAQCERILRPQAGEVAFVTPGAPLFNVSERCLKEVLIIPYAQHAGAVSLEEGAYPLIRREGERSIYALSDTDGRGEIKSCPLCDPLKEVSVFKRTSLCVLSELNVLSCAAPGALSFVFGSEVSERDDASGDNLVYAGREGEILRFEAYNAAREKVATVSYDLREGRVLRYLTQRFEVISADNQGLYFTRRESPPEDRHNAPSE